MTDETDLTFAIAECQAWRQAVVDLRDLSIEWHCSAIEDKCFDILMSRALYPITETKP